MFDTWYMYTVIYFIIYYVFFFFFVLVEWKHRFCSSIKIARKEKKMILSLGGIHKHEIYRINANLVIVQTFLRFWASKFLIRRFIKSTVRKQFVFDTHMSYNMSIMILHFVLRNIKSHSVYHVSIFCISNIYSRAILNFRHSLHLLLSMPKCLKIKWTVSSWVF